jgi:hypothetical protein
MTLGGKTGVGPIEPEGGETLVARTGAATLWIRSTKDEWLIAHSFIDCTGLDQAAGTQDPDARDWTRFVTAEGDTVGAYPALPDRPVVVRPLAPIEILPGRRGRFYFSVPLWIRFVSGSGSREQTMTELPTQDLSSSWFGDMQTGELCYSIGSRLLRSTPETDADDAYARCEVEIHNGSRERLKFQRFCVHVEHMRLYRSDGKYWSNPVRVTFKGAEQVSQLTYLPGPPQSLSSADVVCEPREALDLNIFKRSFNLIREITGI